MRSHQIFNIEIKDNKYEICDKNMWQHFLMGKSGIYKFIVKKEFKQRSLKANAYYFGCVLPILADYMGETDLNYVHAILKAKFLSRVKTIQGKEYWAVGKTSKMDTAQFQEFLEKVITWGRTDLGLLIPEADPTRNEQAVLYDTDGD